MKSIKAPTQEGKPTWVIVPDITLLNYIKSHNIDYLDIFYALGQFGLKKKQVGNEAELVMKDLNNRLVQLKYFANEVRLHEKRLLDAKEDKKRIYSYKPYQVLLGLIEAYLDKLHGIVDLVKKIDKLYFTDFSEKIYSEKWFMIQIGLRHLFHHIESPLITKKANHIMIVCKRVKSVRSWKKYFENWMLDSQERLNIKFSSKDIEINLIKFLNEMAKAILSRIDPHKSINVFTAFDKEGGLISKKHKLKDLLNLVD